MGARYVTWVDGREATVELVARDGARVTARIEVEGEDPREVSFERLTREGGGYQAVMPDGRVLDGRVLRGLQDVRSVTMGERRVDVRAIAERDAWLGGGAAGAGEGRVTVSMPGRVVKVNVEVGEAVATGQPLLIIEAMKMENEVKAPRDGVVTAVNVAAGQSVEAGVVLVEIGDE